MVERNGFELPVHFWNFLTSVPEGVLPLEFTLLRQPAVATKGTENAEVKSDSRTQAYRRRDRRRGEPITANPERVADSISEAMIAVGYARECDLRVLVPSAAGLKVSITVQLVPLARVEVQPLWVMLTSPGSAPLS